MVFVVLLSLSFVDERRGGGVSWVWKGKVRDLRIGWGVENRVAMQVLVVTGQTVGSRGREA